MTEAAGHPLPAPTVAVTRAIAELSLAKLRSREERHAAVAISDLFTAPSFELMRTINHPGNPLWEILATRVSDHLGIAGSPVDVGRPLLNAVHAPRSRVVIDAWGLDALSTDYWVIGGHHVSDEERRRSHVDWYRAHPDVLAAGLERHADAVRVLAAG